MDPVSDENSASADLGLVVLPLIREGINTMVAVLPSVREGINVLGAVGSSDKHRRPP
jgi:hypothetical protein